MSHKTNRLTFDFLKSAKDETGLRIQDNLITTSLASGALRFSAGAAGESTVDLGGAGAGIPVGDLLSFEASLKFDSFDEDLDVRVGVANAFNADPDTIGEVAFFKLRGKAGAANANDVFVETRDTNRDLKGTATDKTVIINQWQRYRIDFATGIQSVSAPAKSKGGLGSVRFACARESVGNAHMEHVGLQEAGVHMDMSDAVGPLQPFVQVRLVGAPGATVTVDLKDIELEYRVY